MKHLCQIEDGQSASGNTELHCDGTVTLRGGFVTMDWLLGARATLIRRCHVVLMSAEAFANLISCGGARRPLI